MLRATWALTSLPPDVERAVRPFLVPATEAWAQTMIPLANPRPFNVVSESEAREQLASAWAEMADDVRRRANEFWRRAIEGVGRALRAVRELADRTADETVRGAARHVETILTSILRPASSAIRHGITDPASGAIGPIALAIGVLGVIYLTSRRGAR